MILCLGTTPTVQRTMVFEHLQRDEVNRAKSVREFASGKAINVARVLKALGEDAVVTGFAGGDRGGFLRRDLDTERIRHELVDVAAPTRLCTTVVDRADGTATELVEEAKAVEPTDWPRLYETVERVSQGCEVWVFSGSLPPGAPQDAYARWVELARQRNVKLIIDARGEPLRLAMKHPGFVVKVNRQELAATVDMELPTEAALKEAMRAATPAGGAIVVTAGKDGSWAYDGQRFCHLTLPGIEGVNPIGSGDAYAAGLAAGLRRGMDWTEACRLGAACGAANVLTQDAGYVELTAVQTLFQQTSVREGAV